MPHVTPEEAAAIVEERRVEYSTSNYASRVLTAKKEAGWKDGRRVWTDVRREAQRARTKSRNSILRKNYTAVLQKFVDDPTTSVYTSVEYSFWASHQVTEMPKRSNIENLFGTWNKALAKVGKKSSGNSPATSQWRASVYGAPPSAGSDESSP